MGIEKKPFIRYELGEKPKCDAFTIWLNPQERAKLEEAKKVLQQPKDSTAFKALAEIGFFNLIGDKKVSFIIGLIFRNKRLNFKSGAFVEQPPEPESNINL
jgi:hypothetical protein